MSPRGHDVGTSFACDCDSILYLDLIIHQTLCVHYRSQQSFSFYSFFFFFDCSLFVHHEKHGTFSLEIIRFDLVHRSLLVHQFWIWRTRRNRWTGDADLVSDLWIRCLNKEFINMAMQIVNGKLFELHSICKSNMNEFEPLLMRLSVFHYTC